jgi:hypothetical protein
MSLEAATRGRAVVGIAGLLAMASVDVSSAQTGDQNTARAVAQGPAEQPNSPLSKDALNRLCLDVEAVARPSVWNEDHCRFSAMWFDPSSVPASIG